MKTLYLRAHINQQGQLTVTMPSELADQEVDLVIVYEPVQRPVENGEKMEPDNWPPGLFAATAGAWQGEPLVREDEGDYEVRDP